MVEDRFEIIAAEPVGDEISALDDAIRDLADVIASFRT
jgi:hypothetical protein